MTELYPYLLFFIGTALLLYSLFYQFKSDDLLKTGILAEGTVFAIDEINTIENHKKHYQDVTIRFLTADNEWITAKYNTDLQISYPGQYFSGETVSIKYNPENPQDFIILSKQSHTFAKLFFAIIGVVLMIYGIYQYLNS